MQKIIWDDFAKVELRVGTIVEVEEFPEARTPAYKLTIDFGEEIGIKKSSSQITDYYSKDELVDTQVVAVVNFPPKQVGSFISEVLTTGLYDQNDKVVLVRPTRAVPNGSRLL